MLGLASLAVGVVMACAVTLPAAAAGSTASGPGGDPVPLGTCTAGVICGTVQNAGGSDDDLWIINNWPPDTASGAFLSPGETSTKYFKDTDGFYIPTGCKGVRSWAPDLSGGAWYKMPDTFHSTIRLDC